MKRNRLLVQALPLDLCLLLTTALVWLAPARAAAVSFSTLASFYGTNGAQPVASLLLAANGSFYGTTFAGGANGYGTIFRVTPAGTITTLASFDGMTGANPSGPLVQGSDGNFYGTASAGGSSGNGTVFMLSASNTLSAVASFAGGNGAQPRGGVVIGSDGALYGTTYVGGAYGLGTVFMVDTNGTLNTLVSFDGTTNGAYPMAGLTAGAGGNLYGTASAGGLYHAGTVFRLAVGGSSGSSTNGTGGSTNVSAGLTFTNLYVFTGAADGAVPQGALLLGADGNFYGTTVGGGTNGGHGTVFKLSPAGAFSSLFSFARTNGAGPAAPLAESNDGNLYGTTRTGGANGHGTVFSLNAGGGFAVLHSFTGGTGGSDPHYSGLTAGADGNFYGVTSLAGRGGVGTFYRVAGFEPYVMGQSANQTVLAGTTVVLGVAAGGSPPLTYHWQRNGSGLRDGSTFSGTTTDTLTIANATTANSGTYTVLIKNSAGSVTNSGIVLTVLNPYGTDQPTLHIGSPAPGVSVKSSVVTVSGSTSCSVPVDQVYYQVNGGGWQLASPQGNWGHWTAKMVVPFGTNVFQAYALNIVGTLSLTNTVSFVCGVTSAQVSVQVYGAGTVSPNYNEQWLDVAQGWKMLAKPRPGYVFSNWVETVASNAPIFLDSAVLHFNPQSNLVVQANFVPSPFVPLSGAYNGLFYETNGVTPQSAGFVTLNLTGNGAFSGRVQLGAARYPMSGQFNLNGAATVTLSQAQPEPLQLALQLDLYGGSEQISGTLSNGNWTAAVSAARAPFDGRARLAPQAGHYTLVLPSDAADATQPGGDSYGVLTVDTAGRLRFSGALADGTKVTQSVQLSRLGQWPLYASLYKGGGVLLGACLVSNVTGGALSGEVTWSKPVLPEAAYYPGGFTVVNSLLGSHYTPPVGTANPLSFTSADAVLSGGEVTQSITNQVVLGSNNRISVVNGPGLTLSFTPATGLVRGTAAVAGAPKPEAFGGVVLQDQLLGRGCFFGQSQSGSFLLLPASVAP